MSNPALQALLQALEAAPVSLGQVTLSKTDSGYEIRPTEDLKTASEDLNAVNPSELRQLSTTDAEGRFRPIKATPDLRTGWYLETDQLTTLWQGLNALYPGALGDWHAWSRGEAKTSDYASFAGRQTGMFRSVGKLSPEEAAEITRACCVEGACLKQRLWDSQQPDPVRSTEEIPLLCLEPCSLHLEMARREFKRRQLDQQTVTLTTEDWDSIQESLRLARQHPSPELKVADFANPLNPRRLHQVTQRLQSQFPRQNDDERE